MYELIRGSAVEYEESIASAKLFSEQVQLHMS